MSIDPLKINVLIQQVVQQAAGQATAVKSTDFERLLEAVRRDDGHPELVAVEQANSALKLAQLQLLHGLIATDTDSEKPVDIFAALRMDSFAAPVTGHAQQVDQLYRAMQPSLLQAKVPGRSDIEMMIDQVAEKVSLAPELIHSVVAAESDFRSQAVSPAGAQGLMQLMPATAKDLGVQDSFDPQQNLLGGSRYLKQLLDKYEGDLDKTLAAYNWGQGNVDRKGLEQMPQETRAYLAKVKGLLTAKG